MQKVIATERTKPIEVSKAFVLEYERKEKENAEKLSEHVDRHIGKLKTLREKVEQRTLQNSRTNAYRSWRKDFDPKKNAVLSGKTLDEVEQRNLEKLLERERTQQKSRSATKEELVDVDISRFQRIVQDHAMKSSTNRELSSVLDSLHKLSELENRITSLESDNAYEQLSSGVVLEDIPEVAPASTKYQFKKHRVPAATAGAPLGVVFTMKPKKQAWTSKKPAMQVKKRPAARPVADSTGAGFFLTEFEGGQAADREDVDFDSSEIVQRSALFAPFALHNNTVSNNCSREQLRRERNIQLAKAPAGQRALRNRIDAKKTRMKEAVLGARRHEDAMKEIIRRRHELQQRPQLSTKPSGTRTTRGASSGVRSNNKYMRDFEKLKSGYERKRGKHNDRSC